MRFNIRIDDHTNPWWTTLFHCLRREMDRTVIQWFIDLGNPLRTVFDYESSHPDDDPNVVQRKFTDLYQLGILEKHKQGHSSFFRLNTKLFHLPDLFVIERPPLTPI